MKNRKLISLLSMILVISMLVVGCGKDADPKPATDGEEPAADVAADGENQLIIGKTSELSGDWGAPYFQNNASDRDITQFIRGYGTVVSDFNGKYILDETVVKDLQEEDNEDGSKTFTFEIADDLKWSDGEAITAKDYVAGALFWSSKVVGEQKGNNTSGRKWVGWEEYSSGEKKEFEGVRLLDDYKFSITVKADELPYFYILADVSTGPVKLSFWADETVEVKDDGNGAYLSDNFTSENFGDRISKARRELPRPSSGQYVLKSFDESTKVAILEKNPEYKGNYEGKTPNIETIIYKKVNDETAFDELETGQVDILAEVGSGDQINKGLDLVDTGKFNYLAYPRAGYGKIVFTCDFGPTQDKAVRQAIAHLLDRNDFAKSFTGGYGSVVNGPYGEALWFYQETKAELDQKLNAYPYDLNKAMEILDEGGWNLNADGGEYTEGIRHKKAEDGSLVPLELEWCSSENNDVSDLIVIKLQENPDLEKAGIKINQTVMTFPELLNYLYREGDDPKYGVPTYHMFNLATGFTPMYDLRNTYSDDPEIIKLGTNLNYIQDAELAELAKAIAMTEGDDRDGFKEKFVGFVEKWNDLLPDLPLYSNIYHDFFNKKLENYETNNIITITDALINANIAGY